MLLFAGCLSSAARGQNPGTSQELRDLITRMANNEIEAKRQPALFRYTAEERSTRTGGKLWREQVVETPDGIVRRLIAVDGQPLGGSDLDAENRRLRDIVADPAAFKKLNAGRKDDESHALELLRLLPKAFLLSPAGDRDGCLRVAFKPDPAYSPSTYEERVIHAMVGTIAVQQNKGRLCSLDASIGQQVDFGFGLLGRLNQGGKLGLERVNVAGDNWKTSRIELHLNGRVLLLKNLTKEQTTVRTNVRVLADRPTIAQAVELSSRPA